MLNFMTQVDYSQYDYSSLRWMMTGAAPVPVALNFKCHDIGVNLLQIYGLTETCGPTCIMDAENSLLKPASTGRAFFHTDVRIVDDEGRDCPA